MFEGMTGALGSAFIVRRIQFGVNSVCRICFRGVMKYLLAVTMLAIVFASDSTQIFASDTLVIARLDLNGDCVADTAFAIGERPNACQLAFIRWGVRNDTNHCDSLWYSDTTKTFFAETVIRYPSLDAVSTSAQKYLFNLDQVKDLLIGVKAKEVVPFAGPDSTTLYRDTSFVVVLLAQRGVDTVDTLDLSIDTGLVTSPITMRYLYEDDGIVRIGASVTAYCVIQSIPQIDIEADVLDTSSMARISVTGTAPKSTQPVVSDVRLTVFPNPSSGTSVKVECRGLNGSGNLRLYDLQGQTVFDMKLSSTARVCVVDVDLESIPAGLFGLTIIAEDGRAGHTSLHIVR